LRHTQILQNLGHVPHQGSQPACLNGTICLDVPKKPPKLKKLHQLVMIILAVEPSGMCLRQCRHTKFQVSLLSIELNLLLCQDLVKVKDEPTESGVSLHLVKVHFSGSIGLGLLCVKGGTDLDESLFGNARLILPRGEGFLPSCELPLPRKELLHRWSWQLH
jgi:hypothetical protein